MTSQWEGIFEKEHPLQLLKNNNSINVQSRRRDQITKIIVCWHHKIKRRRITGPLKQNLKTIRRALRAIKINQLAR